MKITQNMLMRGMMLLLTIMICVFFLRIIVSMGNPILLGVSATKLSVGSELTLWGIGFGIQDKGGEVLINDSLVSDAHIKSWSSLRIRIRVSSDVQSGYIYVSVKNKLSNRKFIFVSASSWQQDVHENTTNSVDAIVSSERISITMPLIVYPQDTVRVDFLDTTRSPQVCRTYIQSNTMTSKIKNSMWHYDSGTTYLFSIHEMLWFNDLNIGKKAVTITCYDDNVVERRFTLGDIGNSAIDMGEARKQYRIFLEYDNGTGDYSYMLPLQTSWQQRKVFVDVPYIDSTLNYLMLYKTQSQLEVSVRRINKPEMADSDIPLIRYTSNLKKMIPQYLFDHDEIVSQVTSIASFPTQKNILFSDMLNIIEYTNSLFTKEMANDVKERLSLFQETIPNIGNGEVQRHMINALLLRVYGLIVRTVVGVRYDAPSLQATRDDEAIKTVEGKHVLWLEILSENVGWIPIFLADFGIQSGTMNNEMRGELNDSYIALYIIEQYSFLVHHRQRPIRPKKVLFDVYKQ